MLRKDKVTISHLRFYFEEEVGPWVDFHKSSIIEVFGDAYR